jgi:hypothetical protein
MKRARPQPEGSAAAHGGPTKAARSEPGDRARAAAAAREQLRQEQEQGQQGKDARVGRLDKAQARGRSSSAGAAPQPAVAEGPHFSFPSIKNDEWQTTRRSWAELAPLLARFKGKTCYMPFYYDGLCAEHLRSLGFRKVLHSNSDFFKQAERTKFMDKVDLIVDNPPYCGKDMKEKVLQTLARTGKPFVMLLPSSVLHSRVLLQALDPQHIQVVYPRRVFVKKTDADEVPFKYLIWLAYRCSFKRDVYFIGDSEAAADDD